MFDFTSPPAADALRIIRQLRQSGYVAYLAGGCVRDALLGLVPKDFDVATDATPDKVREIFGHRRTLAFGASFGVIGVQGAAAKPTEVATFRSDGSYSDGRRPDHVRYGTAEEDAVRRDYTINGLFYDPIAESVVDFVDGRRDLARRVIRAIGDPEARIAEDKLRMLRAVRFAAFLGFSIDPPTADAIRHFSPEVTVTSGERVGAEMRRMLGSHGAATAIELLRDSHLLRPIWPGLEDPALFDLAVRIAGAVQPPDFLACVAAIVGATHSPMSMIEDLAERWRLSCDERDGLEHATHDRDTLVAADTLPWSVVQPKLIAPHRGTAIAAAQAWSIAQGRSTTGTDFCHERLASWSPERLDPPPLVTGQSLIDLGHRPGPHFKHALAAARAAQLDDKISTPAEAIELARSILANPASH